MTTRRTLLAATLATGVTVPLGAGRAGAAPPRPRLALPRPTGPHRIGTVPLHLIDRSRPDPITPGRSRELMASVWYPAATRDARHYPLAEWMPAASWRALIESIGIDPDAAGAPWTAGHERAPVLRGRFPVVMYSHGNNTCRAENTIMVQELASHGYIVVTVDSTYDGYSEFPDGRVTVAADELPYPYDTPWGHAYDTLFALDCLEAIVAGRNPDAGRRPLPAGLSAAPDLRRVGMSGWSKGATATALAMNTDRRIRAGLALDGPMQSQPPVETIDRPFMLMTAELTPDVEPSVDEVWRRYLTGWKLAVQLDGGSHNSFGDAQALIPQLARLTGMSDEDLAPWVGELGPARAIRIQQAYPRAFFDQHLRGRHSRLLDGPSPAFRKVLFLA